MSPSLRTKSLTGALALGLGLAPFATCPAQVSPSGANISTGSGAGTSPGVSPGSSPSSTRTGTGSLTAPASPGSGAQASPSGARPNAPGTPNAAGVTSGLDLPRGIIGLDDARNSTLSQSELDVIDANLLRDARAITQPADRAAAMDRVARAKIFSHVPGDNRLDDAHVAVTEGGRAALDVQDSVTRNIRLLNLVRTCLSLADEETREALTDATDPSTSEGRGVWTPRRRFDWLTRAEGERRNAADLASRIDTGTLRSEMLFRVVDSAAQGSQGIAQQALLADRRRSDLTGVVDMFNRMADRGLVFAANDAARITMPIWRDRAMVSIAIASAASEQFARGIEICRTIPQPQYRADALIRLAEAQARRNLGADATRTYAEAARAVASINLEDPRATLAAVLVDSLISAGRFDDARACVPFFNKEYHRLEVLGVIAENQGERRLADSAFAWIDRDAPPEIRDRLKQRVNEGVVNAYEKARSNPNAMGDAGVR